MKVRIVMTLEVDPEAWDQTYGTGTSPAAIRADVQNYFINGVAESPLGQDGSVTVVKSS